MPNQEKVNSPHSLNVVIVTDTEFESDSAIRAVWVFDTRAEAHYYAAEWNRAEKLKASCEDRDQTAYAETYTATPLPRTSPLSSISNS